MTSQPRCWKVPGRHPCRGWGENIPFPAGWIWGRTRSPLPVLSSRAGGHRLPPIPQSLSSWLCRHSAPAGARPGSPHSTSLVLEKVERSQEQQSPGQEEIPRHSGPAFAAHTLPRLSSGRGGDSDSPGREGLSPRRGSPHPLPAVKLFQVVLPWKGLDSLLPILAERGSRPSGTAGAGKALSLPKVAGQRCLCTQSCVCTQGGR